MADVVLSPSSAPRTVLIIGTGLIGGSIGMALRELGWYVAGVDVDDTVAQGALDAGALDAVGWPDDAHLTIVATPSLAIPQAVNDALKRTSGWVTDVGSVKFDLVRAVDNPRFVGGHPMAGSEQEGIAGARSDMFNGATWVLTPGDHSDDAALAAMHVLVKSLGAEVLTLDARQHDRLVAMVSHVPHLTAATLMRLADERSEEHRALLKLAAGGFRDMTRIASGRPSIWPDICAGNKTAIVEVLDDLIVALQEMRGTVQTNDSAALLDVLTQAQRARVNLPTTAPASVDLAVVRVVISDQPGELAVITRLATDIDVNIYDLEIAHSAEGTQGVLVLVVEQARAERLMGALMANGYRPSVREMAQ